MVTWIAEMKFATNRSENPSQGLQIVFPGFTKIAYNNCESINRETIASNDSKNHEFYDSLFHFTPSSGSRLEEYSPT